MFAITTFAQSTFAGLGIVDYVDSVSETITLTNVQTSSAQFVGTQDNTQTLTNVQTGLAGFLGSLTESQTLSNVETAVQNFPVTESSSAVTLSTLENVIAAFVGTPPHFLISVDFS